MYELLNKEISCPYCGETIDILVDTSESEQDYIEDCQVCCRPIMISVMLDDEGEAFVSARDENET